MSFFERLQSIPRITIYVLVIIVLSIPLIFPISLPLQVAPMTQAVYDAIEALEPGSIFMLSTDWEASTEAESGPQTEAIVRHVLGRDLKLIIVGLWPQGNSATQQIVERIASEMGKTYGVDWVNLGYKPGGEVVLASLAANLRELYSSDVKGTPLDQLEICRGLTSAKDVDLVCSVSWGDPGHLTWVKMVQTQVEVPVVAAVTAVSLPGCAPYLQSGQLLGVVGGLGGAAQYEKLVGYAGKATAGMGAQSFGHILVLTLVVLGNIGYLATRKSKEG